MNIIPSLSTLFVLVAHCDLRLLNVCFDACWLVESSRVEDIIAMIYLSSSKQNLCIPCLKICAYTFCAWVQNYIHFIETGSVIADTVKQPNIIVWQGISV